MKLFQKCLAAAVVALFFANAGTSANAEVMSTNFSNPAFFGQPQSTYQFWNGFAYPAGPNVPNAITNPAATLLNPANAYDASGAPDLLPLGSWPNLRFYTSSSLLLPTVVVPGLNLGAAWTTQLVLQVEASGTAIDLGSVTVTPLGGSPVTVALANATSIASPTAGRTDYQFVWSLPGSVSKYTLNFNGQGSSMSWAGVRVDTLTTAVPEPASLGLLALGGAAMVMRRRRNA